MNCAEIAFTLQETLLYQRDPEWMRAAYRHAEQCPGCARLLELHQVEESLVGLSPVDPSDAFLESVMNRVTEDQRAASLGFLPFLIGLSKYPTLFMGALILGLAYLVPATGQSWISNLWPSAEALRLAGLSAYLVQHPPWAMVLAGLAALMVLMGLALPDPPMRESV